MKPRLHIAGGILLLALGGAGCQDAARRPAQARGTARQHGHIPALAAAQAASAALPPLPLHSPGAARLGPLSPQVVGAREYLLARVQAKFAAGEEEYRAGHLAAARRDFDQAVDWLLESGYDLSADAPPGELFRRIVDTVYGYELQAFRAGDGFEETSAVAAPIDEVAEMTFPVDPRLKDRAEEAAKNVSHDLPLTVNDTVLSFLNFFQTPRGRAIVETGLRRAGRYRGMIARVLREEGLPQDLIYLAQAESAFQPQALSRAGARGIWQFVAYRGQQYGLRHTWWVDERQDPEKATRAAARHLRDLYAQFGDWYLTMAAYNCGPGNVQKAVERTGYADFWELYKLNVLPRETKNYVPIILALTLIAKDAAHYGIAVEPETPALTDLVKPRRPIDLRLVAETIDVDVETLRALNPALLRLVTPAEPDYELRLPQGTAGRFFSEIAAIPADKWVSWRQHRVAAGETLTAIAKRFRVTPAAIAEVNSLERSQPLEPGQKLIIPAAQAETAKSRLVRYRVRRGDTLGGIADRFSVTSEEVRRWNRLRANRVSRGMMLRIYTLGGGPERTPAAQAHRSAKRARKGLAGASVAAEGKP
ncbi:MAG: transglycosylase SLT domain-containing protein [Acidobacteriia bacterium]|nr:transglycosylase SLT domain-containing protein [Terriglobia bacterium]